MFFPIATVIMDLCTEEDCCYPCLVHHTTCITHSRCVVVNKDPPSALFNPIQCDACGTHLVDLMRRESDSPPAEAELQREFLAEVYSHIDHSLPCEVIVSDGAVPWLNFVP